MLRKLGFIVTVTSITTWNDRGEKTLEAKPGLTKRKENAHRVRGKLPEGDVGGGERDGGI